jgi:adenylate cyclase
MRGLLVFCLLLLCFAVQGQERTVFLSRDSIKTSYRFDENWKFMPADSAAFALPFYDDSRWYPTNPMLWHDGKQFGKRDRYDNMGWFRLHFIADTSIVGRPLALSIQHYGASEIYMDGKLVETFGAIQGDSSEYYNPHGTPIITYLDTAGWHVLAIRYANYSAIQNEEWFNESFYGFSLTISEADAMIRASEQQTISTSFIFVVLFGIFMALATLHFILYLYYRSLSSNLYFSLFSFCLALLFFVGFLRRVSNTPQFSYVSEYLIFYVTALTCFSLSGFVNTLFGRRKLRFKIVIALCFVVTALRLYSSSLGLASIFLLLFFVSIEAVLIILIAIIRKKEGAGIIGAGLFLFAILLVSIIISILVQGDFVVDENTLFGQIVSFLIAGTVLSIPISMSAYLAWSFSKVNKGLKVQLEQVKLLSEKSLQQEQEKQQLLESRKEELEKEVVQRTAEVMMQKEKIEKQHEELKMEKKKSDDLLLNILPAEIAEELKDTGTTAARYFDHVTVLFTDFVDFTQAGEHMSPQELVNELHSCFKAFDDIISSYGIEKIKTIGDAYLAVSGIPVPEDEHGELVVRAALEIRDFMVERKQRLGDKSFSVRIGIHSGPVVAGIVGVKKFAYDVWGDTVNTAARMEQSSEPGKINVSQTTYELISSAFNCSYRGRITAKNKGEMNMYFVEQGKGMAEA